MKTCKKVMESVAITTLAIVLAVTAVTTDNHKSVTEEKHIVATELEKNGMAGYASVLSAYEAELAEEYAVTLSVEKEDIALVAAAEVVETDAVESEVPEKKKENAEETAAEPKLTEEEAEWQDKLMAKVDDYLNVRAKADADAKIVGKLYKGDRAVIKKAGKSWTKIESGNVTGYVLNEYCVTGTKALKYAKKHCDTVAKITTDGLRVRSKAGEDASVIKTVAKGDQLVVDQKADPVDGWVAVKVESKTCYVSADYVKKTLDTGKAITIEEELAALKKAEEEKAARQAAAIKKSSNNGQTTATSSTVNEAVSVSVDDETLLAAIIQCEAGGCSSEAMTAVGAVVLNRVRSGSYPSSIHGVIYQRGQFSPVASGKLARRLASGVSGSARAAAQAALAGNDPTGGAKSFRLASTGRAGVVIGPIVFF